MHEVSIAESILQQALAHVDDERAIRAVRVVAGPLRAIDDMAMQWAWQSVTADRPASRAKLDLRQLPWKLHCAQCGNEWQSSELDPTCKSCGCGRVVPLGGDELLLESLEVDDPPAARS